MILRKVSNLKPGDVIRLWEDQTPSFVIESIEKLSDYTIEVSLKGWSKRLLNKDDLVEIVIL